MPLAGPAQTEPINVGYLDGEAYEIRVRGHRICVDQPAGLGDDSAATPTELFVGSLAACVAFYAGRYLTCHGFGRDGLEVHADFDMSTDRPAQVARSASPYGYPTNSRPGAARR
jgi:putative redox protein